MPNAAEEFFNPANLASLFHPVLVVFIIVLKIVGTSILLPGLSGEIMYLWLSSSSTAVKCAICFSPAKVMGSREHDLPGSAQLLSARVRSMGRLCRSLQEVTSIETYERL